jgi:hypothetical protein
MTGVTVTFLKPRLRYECGVWDCGILGMESQVRVENRRVWGFGYCPKSAYDDWLTQFNRYRLFGEGK